MIRLLKNLVFVVLISPLAALGMEGEPDKIELGEQLRRAACIAKWTEVERLIKLGADPNQQNDLGETPLMNAAMFNEEHIVKLLIDAGADLSLKSSSGESALKTAGDWDNYPSCRCLINAMLKQNNEQKERMYALLLCLKQIPGFKNTNQGRDLFKPYFSSTLHNICHEISQIERTKMRERLLEEYGFQPTTNPEPQQ